MKNGELYDSPFFSFSGGRIRSGGLCTCLPSTLSACIGLCLPSALFVCVCLCLCQVCLSAAPCLRVCLRWLSVCLFAVCLCLCQVCLSAAPCLRVCLRWLSVCLFAVCLCLCQVCLSAAPCLRSVCRPPCLSAAACLPLVPIPSPGALCAPSNGGRNGRWRRLRSRGPTPKAGP